MNVKQLEFVMDLLNITAINRRHGIENVVINGDSAYSVELFGDLPKNTINRDALRCSKKWSECLKVAEFVMSKRITDIIYQSAEEGIPSHYAVQYVEFWANSVKYEYFDLEEDAIKFAIENGFSV